MLPESVGGGKGGRKRVRSCQNKTTQLTRLLCAVYLRKAREGVAVVWCDHKRVERFGCCEGGPAGL